MQLPQLTLTAWYAQIQSAQRMCNFHTWIAIANTIPYHMTLCLAIANSYYVYSTSGRNYLTIIHYSTDGKSIFTMQEIAICIVLAYNALT